MKEKRYRPLLLIILTAGSMVIGAKLNFELNGSTITLQTFFLCITALYFKPLEVLAGQLLYLISGFFAPVFASDYMGLAVLGGSSAGYLFAFPVAAFLLARYGKQGDWFAILSWTIMAHALILLGGYLWLVVYIHMDHDSALLFGVMQLLPGAFVKGGAATAIYFVGEKMVKPRLMKGNN